jgi:hypothetical protein
MDDQVTSQLPGAATSFSPTADGTGAPGSRPGAAPGTASFNALWPATVADAIENVVGAVHDRVVRPLMIAARAVVFGIMIGIMGLLVAILLAVAFVRLLTVYAFSGRVWASDALVGALLVVGGAFAWSRARTGDAAGEG